MAPDTMANAAMLEMGQNGKAERPENPHLMNLSEILCFVIYFLLPHRIEF